MKFKAIAKVATFYKKTNNNLTKLIIHNFRVGKEYPENADPSYEKYNLYMINDKKRIIFIIVKIHLIYISK